MKSSYCNFLRVLFPISIVGITTTISILLQASENSLRGVIFLLGLAFAFSGFYTGFELAEAASQNARGLPLHGDKLKPGIIINAFAALEENGEVVMIRFVEQQVCPLSMSFVNCGEPKWVIPGKSFGSVELNQRYVTAKNYEGPGKITLEKHPMQVVNSPIFGRVITNVDQTPSSEAT